MCPVCFASTAMVVAGTGSAGGILAVCISKFKKFFRTSRLGPIHTTVLGRFSTAIQPYIDIEDTTTDWKKAAQ